MPLTQADLLSQRVVVMAAGKKRAEGHPLGLKRRFGLGYRLTCHHSEGADRKGLGSLINSHVRGCAIWTVYDEGFCLLTITTNVL